MQIMEVCIHLNRRVSHFCLLNYLTVVTKLVKFRSTRIMLEDDILKRISFVISLLIMKIFKIITINIILM